MAKKLIYNYKFTPGPSNVGNLEIQGNYPIKVWQLVTDTIHWGSLSSRIRKRRICSNYWCN